MTKTLVRTSLPISDDPDLQISSTPRMIADDSSDNVVTKLFGVTWKYLAVAGIASAIAAVYWAKEHSQSTYEVESRLVFNRSSVGAPLYQSPDVHTLATEFKSLECMEALRSELGLKVPVDLLQRRLKTSVGRGNASINLSLTWEDVDDAKRLLDQIVAIGNQRARSIRDEGISQFVTSIRQTIASRYDPDHQQLVDQYKQLAAKYGVDDIESSLDALDSEVNTLEESIRDEEINLQARLSYREKLDQHDVTLVSHTMPSTTRSTPVTTASGVVPASPTSMLRRMDEIKLDIDRERNRAVAESRLRSKEGELARLRRLADSQLIPRSRYESMLGEVEQLQLAVRGNSPMQQMESELTDLTSQIQSLGNDPAGAIETFRELERKRSEIDQQISGSRIRIEQLEKLLSVTKPELEKIETAIPAAKELEKQLLVASKRIDDQSFLAESLENLKGTDAHVFTVLAQAEPAVNGETSNYRKQFAGSFLIAFLGLTSPVLIFGLKNVLPSPGESLAKKLGVITLASPASNDLTPPNDATEQMHPEAIRLLANRLRRFTGSDSIIQIVELTGRLPTLWLTVRVADCLAQMGEKITVVVAGSEQATESHTHCGLLHTIDIADTQAEQILARVKDCVQDDRLILVTGLDSKHFADVELLSSHVDGVILSAPGGQSINESSQTAAASLAQFQAPILGVVT
ncbi:hypothetical protein [Planctomycetes bacterium K23_9]|uniref:Uncharacterized protein n=1 Tax=Stieleria marina TaxID=1930275 RepID=A0A517NNW1_9BACT|nr:hypothetical protein K239x_07350 [Planctomycetes bacterium K23_9]